MADESYGFTQARVRLEEIVSAVRKKDTSLEKSLDLLEEGVRLANQCTELIDHADWEAAGTGQPIVADAEPSVADTPDVATAEPVVDGGGSVESLTTGDETEEDGTTDGEMDAATPR